MRFWKFSKMRIFSDFRKMCADRGPKMRTNEQPTLKDDLFFPGNLRWLGKISLNSAELNFNNKFKTTQRLILENWNLNHFYVDFSQLNRTRIFTAFEKYFTNKKNKNMNRKNMDRREVNRRKNPLKLGPGFLKVLTQLRVDVIFLRAIDKKKYEVKKLIEVHKTNFFLLSKILFYSKYQWNKWKFWRIRKICTE